jgi:hypothetical protein
MSAPNRSDLVVRVVNQHAELFGSDDTRRGLLYYICETLNLLDNGEWGVLVKDDRGGFIPSDVIVYRSSMEHYDVLAGEPDRPSWQPNGIITNPSWRWERATTMLFAPGTGPQVPAPAPPGEPPAPVPAPVPPLPDTPLELLLKLLEPVERLADAIDELATAVNGARDLALELQRDGIRLKLR